MIAPTPMITPWPGMSRGTECIVPIVPGLVIDTVVPAEVVGGELVGARPADEVFVRGVEAREVEGVGLLDVRHDQRAGAVGLLHVDGEAEVHVLVVHDAGLAVDDAEARVHRGHRAQRAQHREADQVRERHLAAVRACEVVVEDLPVDLEQLGRDRAHDVAVGTSRLASMLLTMRAAAPRNGSAVSPASTIGACPLPLAGAGAAGAVPAAERSLPPGSGVGAAGRRDHSGCGDRSGRCGRLAAGLVVGEEVAPALGDAVGVFQVEAIHLVDHARRWGPDLRPR